MQILLLYIREGQAFDEAKTRRCLAAMPGVSDVHDQGVIACSFEVEYAAADDRLMVHLSTDRETISVHGTGAAARQFVVEFQRQYDEQLHLIDDGYAFDEVLDRGASEQDVLRWLQGGAGHSR